MPTSTSDRFIRCFARAIELGAIAGAERKLARFIGLAWHVVEPVTPFIPGWHLDAVCEHLEAVSRGQIRNLLINIPPRHMKSLAVSVFWPAWEWTTAPHRRWLFASYALSLSERDSVKCRRLIESPWHKRCFGDRYQLQGDQNTKLRYDTTRGGCRIATSVGGAATGEGGDRVVVDDPHNVIDRESQAAREQTLIWWDETMSTRLNDLRTGAKVIVMQRVHEKDLSGHVLQQGGYVHLCLPAEFEPSRRCVTCIGFSDPRIGEGELLWPKRIGPGEIAELKTRLGPEGYAGQFQQRPAPSGGGRFKAEWFRYYEPAGDHYRLLLSENSASEVLSEKCWRFAVMDPAGAEAGAGRSPCYTVIQVWDVTPSGQMLLVHQYREQVQAPDVVDAAVQVCHAFDVPYIAIEKDGLGLGIVQHLRRLGMTVKALKARGPKDVRSQTAEIRMAAGQIFFPRGAGYLFELESELLQFPRSQYMDQADALSHAALEVQRHGAAQDDNEPGEEETHDEGDWES